MNAAISRYQKPHRLEDVLVLIQALARTPNQTGQMYAATLSSDEYHLHPQSAENWLEVAKEHPEFFRVSGKSGDAIMLFCQYLSKEKLSDDLLGKLMDISVTSHDREVERHQRSLERELESRKLSLGKLSLIVSAVTSIGSVIVAIVALMVKKGSNFEAGPMSDSARKLSQRLRCAFVPSSLRGVLDLVDELVAMSREHRLELSWHEDRCQVQFADGKQSEQLEFPLPKSVFRAVLARIAVLCNERHPSSASPYGGQGVITPSADPSCAIRVAFTNTPQELSLELSPVSMEVAQQPLTSVVDGRSSPQPT